MSTLPTKPIERAYIRVEGDPSVGIPHASFIMEMHLDLSCFGDDDGILEATRAEIAKLYRLIHGEPATVRFDCEVQAERAAEEATVGDLEQAEWHGNHLQG